jgi:hypothetical protein
LTKTQQKKYQRVTTAELTEDIKKDYIKSYDDTGVLKYCGEFNHFNWKKDGSGIEYFECGTKIEYKGSFKEDLRHGFGFSYHSNGSLKYRGRFVVGLPHGMGTLYDTDNLLSYKGFFESGVFSSNGQKYEPKPTSPHPPDLSLDKKPENLAYLAYDGSFSNGKKNGKGIKFFQYFNPTFRRGFIWATRGCPIPRYLA